MKSISYEREWDNRDRKDQAGRGLEGWVRRRSNKTEDISKSHIGEKLTIL